MASRNAAAAAGEVKEVTEEAKEEGAWEAPVVDLDSVKEKRAEREAAETAEE